MLDGKKLDIKVGGGFAPLAMDKYTLEIVDVSIVSQFNKFKGEEQEMLNYQFQVLDNKEVPETDPAESTRGRFLWKRCSPSLNQKSWLGKLAVAAYGRDLTKDEMDTFDPESLIGKQVDVMLDQKPSQDGTMVYNNILSFSKCAKKLTPTNYDPQANKVEKTSTPIEVPAEESPDDFIAGLEADQAKSEEDDIAKQEAELAERKAALKKSPVKNLK
jgi:hypothetical protein